MLEQIIKIAEKRQLNFKEFENYFKPYINEEENQIVLFDLSSDVRDFLINKGIKEKDIYQFVFTIIDDENGELAYVNGWHFCNRLGYVAVQNSWAFGNDKDSDIFIAAEY